MAYSVDFSKAARRHDAAARTQQLRQDVAGYLFGIAAECALKQIMRRVGMTPLAQPRRGDDPYYAHFPVLKALLRDNAAGRSSSVLKPFVSDRFMERWDVKMRYAPGTEILERDVARWDQHAKAVLAKMSEMEG